MSPHEERLSDSVTIIQGDALQIVPELGQVDAIITDPPYSSGDAFRGDRMASTRTKYQSTSVDTEHPAFTGDNKDQRAFTAWAAMWLLACLDITVPGGACCIFSDWRQLPSTSDALQAGGWVWRGIVPWDKVNARPMPNRFRSQCEYVLWGTNGGRSFDTTGATYHDGIIREAPPNISERIHATQKPVGVMAKLVEIAPAGSVILDPFMGSATTGLACIRTGRRFIGIEKNPQCYEQARTRLKNEMRQPLLPI